MKGRFGHFGEKSVDILLPIILLNASAIVKKIQNKTLPQYHLTPKKQLILTP